MEGRLLVVDDDPRVRAELSRALAYEGFDVAAAADASGALAAFRAAPPDLLLMEARLPDVDGLEVCRRLRDDGMRVPILIVTGRDAVADRIAGLEAGADDYLVKPFSIRRAGGPGARAAAPAARPVRGHHHPLRRPDPRPLHP